MSDYVYVGIAYRYGNPRDYNFPVVIAYSLEEAVAFVSDHRSFRDDKYRHRIYKMEPKIGYDAEEAELVYSSCEVDYGQEKNYHSRR